MRLLRQNHRLDLMLAAERKDDVGQKRKTERETERERGLIV